jgi:hypothetical protein
VSLVGWICGDRHARRDGYRQGYGDALRSAALDLREIGPAESMSFAQAHALADRFDLKADTMERAR